MSGERVERRLAAILAADVAGYSRLMGPDEAGTRERLRTHRRQLIDRKIAEHKGRIGPPARPHPRRAGQARGALPSPASPQAGEG
jgi:class 3 adenylate cyclase